jgi:hypothetical protein
MKNRGYPLLNNAIITHYYKLFVNFILVIQIFHLLFTFKKFK